MIGMNLAYQVNTQLVIENVSSREAAFIHAAVSALHDRHQYELDRSDLLDATTRIMGAVMESITGLRDGHILIDRFDLPYLRLALHRFGEQAQDSSQAAYALELVQALGGIDESDQKLG